MIIMAIIIIIIMIIIMITTTTTTTIIIIIMHPRVERGFGCEPLRLLREQPAALHQLPTQHLAWAKRKGW